ncbi:hypothetical protein DPMN_099219 [Dreissena polymorpha]|uniref:Uncharacterized protein n=1 Tax=Dreissena polymorpha TaxID=45954 RepID=A0A9D4LDI6_DREPO|nr:hypothetical protein DPMN_099219 [Dreissena polymorpha]
MTIIVYSTCSSAADTNNHRKHIAHCYTQTNTDIIHLHQRHRHLRHPPQSMTSPLTHPHPSTTSKTSSYPTTSPSINDILADVIHIHQRDRH